MAASSSVSATKIAESQPASHYLYKSEYPPINTNKVAQYVETTDQLHHAPLLSYHSAGIQRQRANLKQTRIFSVLAYWD
jgi:hypothetical protein